MKRLWVGFISLAVMTFLIVTLGWLSLLLAPVVIGTTLYVSERV